MYLQLNQIQINTDETFQEKKLDSHGDVLHSTFSFPVPLKLMQASVWAVTPPNTSLCHLYYSLCSTIQ